MVGYVLDRSCVMIEYGLTLGGGHAMQYTDLVS